MTRPTRRQAAALSAALSGAVDLSTLKARAEATARQQARPTTQDGAPDTGASPWVIDVTEADFQATIQRSLEIPVIVDLSASWSEPSQQLSPVLERLAAEAGGSWLLAKVDVDANPRIAQVFGVQSLPTVIAIAAGQPVDAFNGVLPEPQLREWLTALLNALRDRLPGIKAAEANRVAQAGAEVEEPEDPRFTHAEEAFARGDYSAAEAAYQEILAVEPANELAKAALGQVRFAVRTANLDLAAAIAAADAAPDNVSAQLAAADAEIAQQQVEQAFSRLVETIRRTAGEERDRTRQHLVELFELFDTADERVLKGRRALASALF